MSEEFDLDAAAADARGEDWSFRFKGERFTIGAGLPLAVVLRFGDVAAMLQGSEAEGGVEKMLGVSEMVRAFGGLFRSSEDFERFLALSPTQIEMQALFEELGRRTAGASLGESSASPTSSGDALGNSKPTSPVSTGSP
jgi:hypothetical protein